METKAIVKIEKDRGLVPTDMDGMFRIAKMMVGSGLMPYGLNNESAVMVALQMGFELGLTPMQAVQNIAVINGRPVIWGDAQLAIVYDSGLLIDIDEQCEGEGDDFKAICTVKRRGKETPVIRTFTMRQAKNAGLTVKKGNIWKNYPERMCQMRARAWALRDGFADVLKGIKSEADIDTDENIEDLKPSENITAEAIVEKAEIVGTNIYDETIDVEPKIEITVDQMRKELNEAEGSDMLIETMEKMQLSNIPAEDEAVKELFEEYKKSNMSL